jgi:hypothetical protein
MYELSGNTQGIAAERNTTEHARRRNEGRLVCSCLPRPSGGSACQRVHGRPHFQLSCLRGVNLTNPAKRWTVSSCLARTASAGNWPYLMTTGRHHLELPKSFADLRFRQSVFEALAEGLEGCFLTEFLQFRVISYALKSHLSAYRTS